MAKAKYKIKEIKKDNTLSFRIPNQIYNHLKKLSIESKQSVNLTAREFLIKYLNEKNPDTDITIGKLKEEKKVLEAKLNNVFRNEEKIRQIIAEKEKKLKELKKESYKITTEGHRILEEIRLCTMGIKKLKIMKSVNYKKKGSD